MKDEAEKYIDTKQGKDKSNQGAAINLFVTACSNITVKEITIEHYRAFLKLLAKGHRPRNRPRNPAWPSWWCRRWATSQPGSWAFTWLRSSSSPSHTC